MLQTGAAGAGSVRVRLQSKEAVYHLLGYKGRAGCGTTGAVTDDLAMPRSARYFSTACSITSRGTTAEPAEVVELTPGEFLATFGNLNCFLRSPNRIGQPLDVDQVPGTDVVAGDVARDCATAERHRREHVSGKTDRTLRSGCVDKDTIGRHAHREFTNTRVVL